MMVGGRLSARSAAGAEVGPPNRALESRPLPWGIGGGAAFCRAGFGEGAADETVVP